MRLLFLDAYHNPEVFSYSRLENDLINALIKNGDSVTIVCPTPCRGVSKETRKEYSKKKTEVKCSGQLTIHRFWAPKERKNIFSRFLRYIYCYYLTIFKASKHKDIDLVFACSTPPFQGLAGSIVAKRISKKTKRNIPFIYNLQDIFPDSLVYTNIAKKNGLLWKIGRRIENKTYKNANRVIVISQGFKQNLLDKGVPETKIDVIPNWIDLENVNYIPKEQNKLFDELDINREKFIVLYAGNFGVAQGAEIILEVAKKLINQKDIVFVIFGGGVLFNAFVQKSETLDNVIVRDLLPLNRISEVYSLGDVALITCKKGIGNSGLPSKFWCALACSTPVIASYDKDSDLGCLIEKTKSGCCVEPNDADALANAIFDIYNKKAPKENRLRELAIQNASKDICVEKILQVFYSVIPLAEESYAKD